MIRFPDIALKLHNFTDDSISMRYVVPTRDMIHLNYSILWIQKSSWELENVIVTLFLNYGIQKMVIVVNLEWNEPRSICQSIIFNLAKRSTASNAPKWLAKFHLSSLSLGGIIKLAFTGTCCLFFCDNGNSLMHLLISQGHL